MKRHSSSDVQTMFDETVTALRGLTQAQAETASAEQALEAAREHLTRCREAEDAAQRASAEAARTLNGAAWDVAHKAEADNQTEGEPE
jgi:hypothetical protein